MNLSPPLHPAKKDSNKANNNAISIAVTNLTLIPFHFPLKVNMRLFLSCHLIFKEIIPARENIIDNSQETPSNRMNVDVSLDTAHKG